MISRKHRFRGRHSLDYIYRRGKAHRAGPLTMKYLPAKGEDFRLAVVVSKKVSKSAVKRNRIRRRVFEQFRDIRRLQTKPIKYDIIVTAFDESLATLPAKEMASLCQKLASALKTRN